MAEPEFTTRGKKVRLAGNTNEKTNCGKVEVALLKSYLSVIYYCLVKPCSSD